MKKYLILAIAVLIGFASCKKDNETEPDNNTNPGSTTTVTQNITVNTTWSKNNVYVIDGTLRIDGATLTIEPGTVVKFTEGSQIEVGYSTQNSTLIANGTAAEPIIFTSVSSTPVAGDWDYIYFGSGATSDCSMSYCTIMYGGGYASNYGMIELSDAKISMTHCTLKYSEYYGICLNDEAEFKNFTQNTIENIGSYAISLYPNSVSTIGTYNNINSNTTKGIKVRTGTFDLDDATWLSQTCPYVIDGTLSIQSEAGATLRIEAPNSIKFTEGSQIEVAYNTGKYGAIIADGTETKPIVFTSYATSPSAGDWDGIFLYDGTLNTTSFTYCTFEYGGGYAQNYGMIDAGNCEISFNHCTFAYSKYNTIDMNDEGKFSSFDYNEFNNIPASYYPIKMSGNWAHTIGVNNTFNTNKGVKIINSTLNQDATWHKLNVAYYIDGTLSIQSSAGNTLTLEPGTQIKFTEGSQIEVAYNSGMYGRIVAQGTASEPIVFTSAAPDGNQGAGDWDAIFMYGGTMSGTVFDNCKFLYGGGYSSSYGMLYITDNGSNVTVSNSEIAYSQYWGIRISDATPTLTNNNYHDNGSGDVN